MVLRDILVIPLLLAGSLALGLIVNECRKTPLPLVYLSPEARLNSLIEDTDASTLSEVALGADVDEKEMRKIITSHSALILDARPHASYAYGHIPSAMSLPRDDFIKSYQILQKTLSSYWNKTIVVYCSNRGCPDSRLVGEALRKLGYKDVRLYRGGWNEWIDAELPAQSRCGC